MWKGDRDIYVTSDWDAFQLQPRYTWAWITLLIHSVLTSSIKRHYFGREQGESWKRQASKTTSVQTSDHTQTLVTQCQIIGEFVNQQHILKCFGLIAYDTFFREKISANLSFEEFYWNIMLTFLSTVSGEKAATNEGLNSFQRRLWMSEIMLIWRLGSCQFS